MPQIYDMGPTALLLLRRKACWEFFFEYMKVNCQNTSVKIKIFKILMEASRKIPSLIMATRVLREKR